MGYTCLVVITHPALALLAIFLAAPQEVDQKTKEKAGLSVVLVRNAEARGSGLILDADGLILTNAHVLVSPLPYQVEAVASCDGRLVNAVFTKVEALGVHPRCDLALIRVNPSEQDVSLFPAKVAKTAAAVGDAVFAIGFPVGTGTKKAVSPGTLTAVSKMLNSVGYYALTANIQQGNSGGPLCNASGEAIGIITFAIVKGEPGGMAVPIHDLRTDRFIPLHLRDRQPAMADAYLRAADKLLKLAREGNSRAADMALYLTISGLSFDIGNPQLYTTIGMIHRNQDRYALAAPYLVRSLQLEPWCGEGGDCYHELGVALAEMGQAEGACAVWKEGSLKYPTECGKIWDALAVYYAKSGNWVEAAHASRVAVQTGTPRGDFMNEIYRNARAKAAPADAARMQDRQETIDTDLRRLDAAARKAREAGTAWITKEGEKFIRDFQGVQADADDGESFVEEGTSLDDMASADLDARFILRKVAEAREIADAGDKARAIELLQEIILAYPLDTRTNEARVLLRELRK